MDESDGVRETVKEAVKEAANAVADVATEGASWVFEVSS